MLLLSNVQMATTFTLSALVYSLVDKQHLPSAIAFNSIQFNLARASSDRCSPARCSCCRSPSAW